MTDSGTPKLPNVFGDEFEQQARISPVAEKLFSSRQS
jgi:hypothetical protein